MKTLFSLAFCLFPFLTQAQSNFSAQEIEINTLLKGTLITPATPDTSNTLVILIAGSGPTNRNGNQPGMPTNCYRFLGQSLAEKGISFFSYDKRIIAQVIQKTLDEKTLRFEDMVTDAKAVLQHFSSQKKYSKIVLIGHSEGSLVGMLAAPHGANAFISLAGPGRPADDVLIEQLTRTKPEQKEALRQCIDALKANGKWTCDVVIPGMESVFRPTVLPYLCSWFVFNPAKIIRELQIPVLIINGDKDLQVPVEDAALLKAAKPDAVYAIIPNMNHVLKNTPDEQANRQSYSDGKLPIEPELTEVIMDFIKKM
ncbi:alpha/beta hydrolase [Flavobacterium sp.]|uniref:alpha/beta hydrolase n=1 Tax=Flavobacterium sp. TaxID=239 RepID=UPI0026109D75|nr:alpha/beta hydrolase [Flavobacterium sp.]